MEAEYWIERWREGRTGWHHDDVMPLLQKHWPALGVPRGTKVLVPFCGKSLDMAWLAGQGCRVLGVEVSPLAVEQFFAENNLQPARRESSEGIRFRAGDIEIIQGDLFDIDAETLSGCGAVYDRAALIAQPPPERERYAREIYAKLPGGCRGLMITLEYPRAEMDGPPFSVEEAEVRQRLNDWDVTVVERRDILDAQPHFKEAGLTSLHTAVYRLQHY
ncbi:MAG: thiopurine S-methyltransferase [Gammaproteobacteria bacterium]|nr:thiopurine S-methyltransferase [Gammaproteobacteria bacterium]